MLTLENLRFLSLRILHSELRTHIVAAGAGIAPAFAPSKGAVLRLDDPAIERKNWNAEPGVETTRSHRKQSIPHSAFYTPHLKWWPARVTRPVPRIKSPLHHFNACEPKWLAEPKLGERRLVRASGNAPEPGTDLVRCGV